MSELDPNTYDKEAERLWKIVPTAPPSHARFRAEQEVWGRAYQAAAQGDALRSQQAAAKGDQHTAASYMEAAHDRAIQAAGWFGQSGDRFKAQAMKDAAAQYEAQRKQQRMR
ncbi:MAG: hypothetical protein ACKVT1_08575 [Dehalococcoidia bacterium]